MNPKIFQIEKSGKNKWKIPLITQKHKNDPILALNLQ